MTNETAMYKMFNDFSQSKASNDAVERGSFIDSFTDAFIKRFDVKLDGRMFFVRIYDDDGVCKDLITEANRETVKVLFEKMLRRFYRMKYLTPFSKEFEIIELSEKTESYKPCSFYSSLEAGRRAVEASEKWEGI